MATTEITNWMPDKDWRTKALALLADYKESGLLPDSITPAQGFLVLQRGFELGLLPGEALASLYVVNGRVSLETHTMIALVHRAQAGHFDVLENTAQKASVMCLHTNGTRYTSTFTIEDAERAGITQRKGEMYKKWPAKMLLWRAIAQGFRVVWPELMGGLYTPEEAAEIPENGRVIEFEVHDTEPAPAPPPIPPVYVSGAEILQAAAEKRCDGRALMAWLATHEWQIDTVPTRQKDEVWAWMEAHGREPEPDVEREPGEDDEVDDPFDDEVPVAAKQLPLNGPPTNGEPL